MDAGKQAHVYIVDQGSTTGECHSGRVESDLDWSLQYVYERLGTVLAANRTTLNIGILGLRTDETDNPLHNEDEGPVADESYEHISVHKALGPILLNEMPGLREKLISSRTEAGDAVSAIVVAIEMIGTYTMLRTGRPGKFGRKIVLVTDGQGYIDNSDPNNLEQIALRLNELDIELIVLGIDFDDLDYGFKEEDKSEQKRENETILRSLTDQCKKGTFASLVEAIDNRFVPEVKPVRPYKAFEGRLALGEFTKYPETALYIDVARYTKIKKASPPSASSFTANNGLSNGQSSATLGGTTMHAAQDLSAVKSHYVYQVDDPIYPGGKRDVERDDLAKGYVYGRTAVHISAAEENITKMETFKSFSIIGFIPSNMYDRYLMMGESCITVAQSVNEKAIVALSSLIHALHELESYAVARIVLKDNNEPKMILLAPVIEPDFEGLADVPLPFAEDVRMYRFPPLDRVVTASGATVSKHRNLPSDELEGAMDNYVDAMDISTFGKDENGAPIEYMTIDETYSPTIHRINEAIKKRALYPGSEVEPPPDTLMQWSVPPSKLAAKAASKLTALQKVADVKKVEAKKKGKRFNREQITPLSGLDIDALLDDGGSKSISVENSIPEFRQTLNRATSDAEIQSAAKQLGDIIRKLVKESVGDASYARALENLRVMREEMMEIAMPEIFNEYIKSLKPQLMHGELDSNAGGSGREFWVHIKRSRLGLIDEVASDASTISTEEATAYEIGAAKRAKCCV